MGSGKDDKKGKTKKKSLSEHYSEEEKYWDSFDDRKSSSLSRDRNYLLMSAKSSQKATQPADSPSRGVKSPLLPPPELASNKGLSLQDNDPNTSRFQVDHLATLHYPSGRPQLPEESVQRMRELAMSGTLYSQQVYLCVSSSYLAIRQFHTNEAINWFPMSQISKVYAYSGKKEFTNLLIVHTHDNRGSKPFIHMFGCERVKNSEIRDLLISFLNRRYSSELTHTPQMDTIEEHSSSGDEAPLHHKKLSIWEKLSSRPSTKSKALIFEEGPAGQGESGSKLDKSPPSHKIGLAAAELNQQRNKANMIQRDIDLLNAALDDVELTADVVHNYVAQQKMGKKKKKGKSSSRSTEPPRPPAKTELVDAFQKSRYAANLLGKLGHHLRNPNCCEILNLLMETIKGLSDFTGGIKLVSAVNVPLLTERTIRLMSRGLNKELKVYWNNLGTNWMLTHSSWPQTKPVPRYDAIFSNGYTPDTLPLNEPTIWGNLDPLPELERPSDYSDAYDHIQVIPQTADKISKEIESVVFKQAKQVKSRTDSHTDSTHSHSSSKQTPQTAARPPSLTAVLPQENQLVITQDYKRRSKEQLSVYRGEVVDVLEKRTDFFLVRNTLGEQGYVPLSALTEDKLPSRRQSPTLPRKEPQPQPLSRRGSGRGIGDVPNFDPTPPPFHIPPPPPDIPPNWPPSVSANRPPTVSPRAKPKTKDEVHMAFEDAGIIRELSKRKPLRTTSTSSKVHPANQQPEAVQSEIALKFQRETPAARKPEVNPITTSSTKEEVLQWLQLHSYLIAAEKLRGMKGSDLISVTKDELRNVCGFGEGTRLYSHLQKQSAGGGGHHQLETLVSGSSAGVKDSEGFSKFLKEHRDKISGKSPTPEEGPSVWEQIQISKAQAEKLERRKQKEEIWAKRRRNRESEERAERQESPPPVEREDKPRRVKKILKKQHSHSSTEDKPSRERKSRQRHKSSRRRYESTESSASSDSDSLSMTSSDYDSYSTSSQSSQDVKETKSKKKEPAPPPTPPAPPAAPQYPTTQMYPQMLPPGYPQVGYMPSPHIQYQEMMTQQLLRNQQVAHAEQDAWNAEMRLKQLRTQQAMGLPPPPTGMYGTYVPPILPATPTYGYPSFERNYTSII